MTTAETGRTEDENVDHLCLVDGPVAVYGTSYMRVRNHRRDGYNIIRKKEESQQGIVSAR
jgi:hypothetical protein